MQQTKIIYCFYLFISISQCLEKQSFLSLEIAKMHLSVCLPNIPLDQKNPSQKVVQTNKALST
jgi:hypothetical protein